MYPLLFGVVPTYGVLLLIAFFAGSEAAARAGRHTQVPRDRLLATATGLLIAAVLGARLLYLVTAPGEGLSPWGGGLSFAGAIPASVVVVAAAARHWRYDFARLADPLCHGAALSQAIGRVGCLLAGCCAPTQLIESAAYLALFLVLRRHPRALATPYRTFALYLVGYAAIRLGVEPWRGDRIPLGGGLTLATLTSLLAALAGLGLLVVSRRAPARTPPP